MPSEKLLCWILTIYSTFKSLLKYIFNHPAWGAAVFPHEGRWGLKLYFSVKCIWGTGEMDQSVKLFLCTHRNLSSVPAFAQEAEWNNTLKSSATEAETGISQDLLSLMGSQGPRERVCLTGMDCEDQLKLTLDL